MAIKHVGETNYMRTLEEEDKTSKWKIEKNHGKKTKNVHEGKVSKLLEKLTG